MSCTAPVSLWFTLVLSLSAMAHAEEMLPASGTNEATTIGTAPAPPASSSLPRLRWSDGGSISLAGTTGDDTFPASRHFDVAAARRLHSDSFSSTALEEGTTASTNTFDVSAGPEIRFGTASLRLPMTHREYLDDQQRMHRFNALGIEWEQEVLPGHRLSLAAEHGGHAAVEETGIDTSRTRASVTVSSALPEWSGAQLSGTVFLGGETPRDEVYRHLGRRFYGFSLEGRFTAFRSHSPYTSFQLQRSNYDTADATPHREDYSRLAAGWDWQIMPNWGLRAEANYSLNVSNERAYEYDRSELFFSTRFNFR